jgi:uncharacterized membrane protein
MKQPFKINMPIYLKIFLAGATPYLNLKLAIPLGMSMNLPIINVLFFALAGDLIPALIILYMLGPLSEFLRKKSKRFDALMEKIFNKTRQENFHRFHKYGAWGLMFYIATPLPGSGNVTGGIIAYILGISYWKTALIVSGGSLISAIIIATGFGSLMSAWQYFF